MEPLPRVFFDANAGTAKVGYLLWFDASAKDLAAMGEGCREGAKVLIYSPGEFECEATLTFDREMDYWRAKPLPQTIRYLDGS